MLFKDNVAITHW